MQVKQAARALLVPSIRRRAAEWRNIRESRSGQTYGAAIFSFANARCTAGRPSIRLR